MRIIVTGASGFIGRNFTRLAPEDWEIVALYNRSGDFEKFVSGLGRANIRPGKCELRDSAGVNELAREVGAEFDVCLYLAANGDPAFSVTEPATDLEMNTLTLVRFLSAFKVRRLVYVSSGAVYHGLEGPVTPQAALNPVLPYAISHLASEQYSRFFREQGRVAESVVVRFFGAYGPYEPGRKVYTKLVRAFHFERAREFTVVGDGENMIDAMYVEDAVEGLLKLVSSPGIGNLALDFASRQPISINNLVRTAAGVFGVRDVTIKHIGQVPEYIRFHSVDDAMARRFGFEAKVSLEDGLRKFASFLEGKRS